MTVDPGTARPRTVLYVNPFAEHVSGPDESLLLLLQGLGARVRPVVVLPPHSPFRPRYEALGATVYEQPLSRIRRSVEPGALLRWGAELSRSAWSLARICRREGVELVHVNMEVCLEGAFAARALRLPCVFHYRGNTNDDPVRVFDVLVKLWLTLGDHVFAISDGCARIFRTRGAGDRVETLYNAVDLARFAEPPSTEQARVRLGIAEQGPVVLTVGRVHPRKDVATFVRMAARVKQAVPDARFYVAGMPEGPGADTYAASLRELAAQLGVDGALTWLGARRDVPDWLAACDVFVMTSRNEGFGRSLAEAMAAGRASVMTDEGAFPELVRNGEDGFLAPAEDDAAFAAHVTRLLGDPGARARLGTSARTRAFQRFSIEAHADRVWSVYQRLFR